jgi:hypothetical protein
MDDTLDPKHCSCAIRHNDQPPLVMVNMATLLTFVGFSCFRECILGWKMKDDLGFQFIQYGGTQCG